MKQMILAVRLWIYEVRFYLRTGLTTSRLKRLWIKLMEDAEAASMLQIERGLQISNGPEWRAVKLKRHGLLLLQTKIVTEGGLMIFIKASYDTVENMMIYTTTSETDWELVLVPKDFENKFVDGEWRSVLKAMCKEML